MMTTTGLYALEYFQAMLEPQLLPVYFLSFPPSSIGALFSMLLLRVGVLLQLLERCHASSP